MNEDHLRLSDAERDAAAADLAEHFAQGRLSPEEHGDRLDQIWAARTRGEIPPIFRDLPSRFAPLPPTRTWAPGRARPTPSYPPRPGPVPGPPREVTRRSRGMPAPVMIGLVLLAVLTVFTHLPLILVGLLIWFVISSGRRSGSRSPWHR